MRVRTFRHEGLGNSSYLVDLGQGRGILVDPDRSFDRYLRAAEADGLRIEAVLETHLHADFVTGAVEAIHAAGARIHMPEGSASRVPHIAARAGDRIALDGSAADVIASPGHTPEHLSYVLRGAAGPPLLFSGGALIAGGAARTDLVAPDMTDRLTRDQFRTLRQSFRDLPDETLLYPTHGGGSLCSATSGGAEATTLGRERAANPAMAADDEEEFVRWFPSTFPPAPDYFFRMRAFNQRGPRLRSDIARPRALTPAEFARLSGQALVVDVRTVEAYHREHLPRSVSIAFRDSYCVWLGWVAPEEAPLLFVADGIDIDRVVEESLLVGYERFEGYLDGGMPAWRKAGMPSASIPAIAPDDAARAIGDGATLVDVRAPSEYREGHLPGALHIPVDEIPERARALPAGRPVLTYCGVGERSATAASLLERAGVREVMSLEGGIEAWRRAGQRVEAA
jgi:rhodanese-related sulfurtransferase/glyoxylase-like metal-dependent hydrolase (beta-lactamase superfamily II)